MTDLRDLPDIPVLVGPTGAGKTEVALALARRMGAEVISADSRQVYRHLTVGTAKPAGKWVRRQARSVQDVYEADGVPHHLMDFLEPTETYNAGTFSRQASGLMKTLLSEGRAPIVAGGTGLYVRALVDGLAPLPERDDGIRKALYALADRDGRPALHRELLRVDPVSAETIPPNNIARIVRALEVFLLTGRPLSSFWKSKSDEPPAFPFRWFGLLWAREDLEDRLRRRCRKMIEAGLVEETRALVDRGVPHDAPGLQALGYRQAVEHVRGKISKDELESGLYLKTRQYAKRQMTWFRADRRIRWIVMDKGSDPETVAEEISASLEKVS